MKSSSSSILVGAALVLLCIVVYTSSNFSENSGDQTDSLMEATRKLALTTKDKITNTINKRKEKGSDKKIEMEITQQISLKEVENIYNQLESLQRQISNQTTALAETEAILHEMNEKMAAMATNAILLDKLHNDTQQMIAKINSMTETENKAMAPTAEQLTDVTPNKMQDLAELLKKAATSDNSVIMTAINDAWAAPGSLLDLFFESFRQGDQIAYLLNHLVIVAMDAKAFERCQSRHPHCYWLRVKGLNLTSEQQYMKANYVEMLWSRNRFQQSILELGYNFLFTDVDILWFRDPFAHFSKVNADLIMASDIFFGDPNSLDNRPNGGLLYVKSGENTIKFYKSWQLSRKQFPGQHEQYVFDEIKGELSTQLGVKIQFLDTANFGGFCQHGNDLSKIFSMHANCCVGLENKLQDLRSVLQDWNKYRERDQVQDENFSNFSWTVPGRCIH